MSFAQDSGYTPLSIDDIMDSIRQNVNTQFGTSYTVDSFVGTNFYKFYYAIAQRLQDNEVKTSEIFAQLQQYFKITNESIDRPANTNPGIINQLSKGGWISSVKKMIDADAGKINICVNVDSGAPAYATNKLAINTIIKDSVAAGIVCEGTESSTIVLTNGQAFAFAYHLPASQSPLLRLTLTLSDNNMVVVGSPDDVKVALIANIGAKYKLGLNFEPERYFTTADAPWCSTVLLEYSLDSGVNWLSAVFDANYDDLFVILLANVSVVED